MTVFVLEGRTAFGGTLATDIADNLATLYMAQSNRMYIGHSYDPVTRRIYFNACVVIGTGNGLYPAQGMANPSAHSVYVSGANTVRDYDTGTDVDTIPTGNVFDGTGAMNYWTCYKDIDTDAVSMFNAFDDTAVLPSGVGGSDGTYRMTVSTTATVDQQFQIVDPRTADVWAHATLPDCNVYVFRATEGYKQRLLPVAVSSQHHMEMVGTNENWLLVINATSQNRGGDQVMYCVPRLTTSDETAVAQLLAYFTLDLSTALANFGKYYSTCMAIDGNCYFYGQSSADNKMKLWKYTPPATVGTYGGSPAPGGTLTDTTPWTTSTGPNTTLSGYLSSVDYGTETTWGGNTGWGQTKCLSLPATRQMALLTQLSPLWHGSGSDPTYYRLDCTYYDIDGATFDYHEGFVKGFMKADWTVATDVSDAAYAIQFMREMNSGMDMHSFDYTDSYGDMSYRWIVFSVQPVIGGTFTWDSTGAKSQTIIAKYRFVYGSPPQLSQWYKDSDWFPYYQAYADAIGNDNVVEQSLMLNAPGIETTFGGGTWGTDETFLTVDGIYDGTTNAFWFGGNNSNSIKINALPTYRGTNASQRPADALVRLSFRANPRASMVWSTIGRPQI